VFAEIGLRPERDQFFVLNYDGEFTTHARSAVVAGSDAAEDAMAEELRKHEDTPDLATALQRAAQVWRIGSRDYSRRDDDDDDDESDSSTQSEAETDPLTEALEKGSLEAAILERDSPRESKFRLLSADEIKI
jgi:proteasome alpha subunit